MKAELLQDELLINPLIRDETKLSPSWMFELDVNGVLIRIRSCPYSIGGIVPPRKEELL
jgi:hypothetical protein